MTARKPAHLNLPATFLARVVILASVAVFSSIWALHRFYTHPMAPMVVAAAPDAGAWDAGAGLIEAPEIEVDRP